MKVGDLVRFYSTPRPGDNAHRGCLPSVKDNRWTACGLVQEVCNDGNVNVLWSERGLELVSTSFLEVINEG